MRDTRTDRIDPKTGLDYIVDCIYGVDSSQLINEPGPPAISPRPPRPLATPPYPRGGRFDIWPLPGVSAGRLPPGIAAFRRAHPEIDVVIRSETSGQLIADSMRSGRDNPRSRRV